MEASYLWKAFSQWSSPQGTSFLWSLEYKLIIEETDNKLTMGFLILYLDVRSVSDEIILVDSSLYSLLNRRECTFFKK